MSKIAIIGAGSVGATIAYASLIRGVSNHVVLYDVNKLKVDSEVLDLNHGLQFVSPATVEGSDDLEICRDAAIVVVTAGAKQKPGQSRIDLAAANAGIMRELIPKIAALAPQATMLMVSNPVDVMTYAAQKLSGWPAARVIGSGTVLDSSRFRFLIARRLKVAVANVHAYIAGEHGESEIPLWSSATVANIPLHQWAVAGHGKMSVMDRTEIFQNVKTAAQQIIAGKGATNYAIGLASARILESLLKNENRVWPVSSLIRDYHGINDVCLSIPCIVNRSGIDSLLPIPLNDAEKSGLANSAEQIRKTIAACGF